MCVDITVLAGGRADLPTPNDRDDIAVRASFCVCFAPKRAQRHSTTTQLRFLEPFGLLILLQLICSAAPASGYIDLNNVWGFCSTKNLQRSSTKLHNYKGI
jgi:hypothetical protein